MSKYTLTIEGDFEKGDCNHCPLMYMAFDKLDDEDCIEFVSSCPLGGEVHGCPLEEVKQGEWIISSDGYYPYCKNCNYRPKGDLTNFCPNCGADMRKTE